MRKGTRRIIMVVEYDGTAFHGWQLQPGLPTVQGALEQALARMMEEPVRVIGSGRTDAGVSAEAQVAHADVPKPIAPDRVAMGLNTMLPSAVRVLECLWAPPSFHARYSAGSKVYRYRILNRPRPTALLRDRVWWVRPPLDLAAMREGAGHLVGTHDFSAFRSAGEEGNAVRTIGTIAIEREGDLVTLWFEGDGFLKHMVRNITGALMEAGLGRYPPGHVRELLDEKSRLDAPRAVPPWGLTLVRVHYPGFDLPEVASSRPLG
jgi:tRNA pseudouridine38-40 synthase